MNSLLKVRSLQELFIVFSSNLTFQIYGILNLSKIAELKTSQFEGDFLFTHSHKMSASEGLKISLHMDSHFSDTCIQLTLGESSILYLLTMMLFRRCVGITQRALFWQLHPGILQ